MSRAVHEVTSVGGQFPAGPPQGKLAPSGLSPAALVLPAQDGTGRRAVDSVVGAYSAVHEVTSVGAIS